MDIGKKIRIIRKQKNISPKQISDKLGVSLNAYHKKETGQSQINVSELETISKVLEVPIQEIVSDNDKYCNLNNTFNDHAAGFVFHNLSEKINDTKDEIIASLKRENANKQEIIDLLKDKLAKLEKKE